MNLQALILAAGAGVRMKSKLPKVLHKVCDKPMIDYVIDAAVQTGIKECIAVVGHGAEEVSKSLPQGIKTVLQEKQLGTGHAVMISLNYLREESTVVVLCGDGPLITADTLNSLIHYHKEGNYGATVLTAEIPDPSGYGRVLRTENQQIERIVEEKDAAEEQKKINEINSGIYCFDVKILKEALPYITNENAAEEYYLTDIITIIKKINKKAGAFKIKDAEDITAVNSREQLAQAEEIMRRRIAVKHMAAGVTIINPNNTYIGSKVKISPDTVLYPGVILSGDTTIGENCIIGHNSRIEDCVIDNAAEIQSSTIIKSRVGEGSSIGPYAYLRPGSVIGKQVKIGDFVEVKNAVVGDYSKASHLSYIGDAEIGRHVNIGCGVVFVNYDGKNKHKTVVEDYAFIGSNSNLVAPVTVKAGGYVASGSTITAEVPPGALAIGRSRQVNKEGWVKRKGLIKDNNETK